VLIAVSGREVIWGTSRLASTLLIGPIPAGLPRRLQVAARKLRRHKQEKKSMKHTDPESEQHHEPSEHGSQQVVSVWWSCFLC